jgi:isoleucyl-tRNA synthetase
MYQNLVRCVRKDARESVHHTRWPQVDRTVVDEELLDQMDLARTVASLGLAARSSANLKVRQPLAAAMAHVAGGKKTLRADLVEIVTDELNVKTFDFVEEAGRLVNYRVLPDNKLLGPRFGAQFPNVRAALAGLDPAAVALNVQSGQPVRLEVDGQAVDLTPGEVVVQTTPVEGLAVATEKGITVAVDATLTPELKAEGLAREIVRRVQEMRKKAGFNIDDRIVTWYQVENLDASLSKVVESWAGYLCAETLTVELNNGQPPQDAYQETHQVEGETITLGVRRTA